MKVINTIYELKSYLAKHNGSLALVPTMGALHEGHLSLVDIAKESAEFVAVTIFVNPQQFNNAKDLKLYPRVLEDDLDLLRNQAVDLVFCPTEDEIYQHFQGTKVHPSKIGDVMEGPFRPGHFAGVCTIVNILFNLLRPDVAIFGEKDFQQLRIIEDMILDLQMDVQIIRAPIKREDNGLARSSRNELLSKKQRAEAKVIFECLMLAKELLSSGETSIKKILANCKKHLESAPELKIEYLTINHSSDLREVNKLELDNNLRIFFAGHYGGVRLIDNLKL